MSTPISNEGSFVELPWRLGIRVVLLFALVLVAYLNWFYVRAERWDRPSLIPVLLVSEFPPLLALPLVVTKRQQRAFACGAGIAFGLGTVQLLLALLLFISIGFASWDTGTVYHNLVQLRKALPAVFLTGVLLMRKPAGPGLSTLTESRAGRGQFNKTAYSSFYSWVVTGGPTN